MKIRVGFGYDVHKLAEGESFILGGIEIPHSKGLLGHSDADVLIHAICDALLGAANMRDIGFHFSDQSAEFKGIDSKVLLQKVIALLKEKGYYLSNVDATIALQEPKIAPYVEEMKAVLAQTMDTAIDNVSIKATSTERLGFEGRGEGVSAYATVLIQKD